MQKFCFLFLNFVFYVSCPIRNQLPIRKVYNKHGYQNVGSGRWRVARCVCVCVLAVRVRRPTCVQVCARVRMRVPV